MSKPDLTARNALPEYRRFAHLAHKPIRVNEAARKYKVPPYQLTRWTQAGFIALLTPPRGQGHPSEINEQDVAYCALIYHRGHHERRRVFHKDGTPHTHRVAREQTQRR